MIDCVFCSECNFDDLASTSKVNYSMDYADFDGSIQPSNNTCYGDFALVCNGEDGNGVEDGGGNDDDNSELEDQEIVRMDLTDDLLHMVRDGERTVFFLSSIGIIYAYLKSFLCVLIFGFDNERLTFFICEI